MDSSGSMQSSSGDEEYDSRAESISAFLTNPSNNQINHSSSTMFDPLSNFFDPLSSSSTTRPLSLTNSNPLLNLDIIWPPSLRSDPSTSDLPALFPSTPTATQPFVTSPLGGHSSRGDSAYHGAQNPHVLENNLSRDPGSGPVLSDNNGNNVVRNPKKRSRASRRAPTTVLNTDTTNFRAMVQEFTGIPAPPFTSCFPRTRLDLFGTSSTTVRSPLLDTPPYLLRPFAQKPQIFSSSSMADSINSTNSAQVNYQFSLLKQTQNSPPMNMQNPVFNFQPNLQNQVVPPKYPLPNSTGFESKDPESDPHLKMGLLEEFSLNHGHDVSNQLSGLPNMATSAGTMSSKDNINRADQSTTTQAAFLRSVNRDYGNTETVSNGKLSYSGSSSDFRGGDNQPEINVTARTEGMVESWICSSN